MRCRRTPAGASSSLYGALRGSDERRGVKASKTLGGLDQFLATLLRLGDPLRQLIARLHADAILGGPLLVEHMLAQLDPAFSWRPPAGSC